MSVTFYAYEENFLGVLALERATVILLLIRILSISISINFIS